MLEKLRFSLFAWKIGMVENHRSITAIPNFAEPAEDILKSKVVAHVIIVWKVIYELMVNIPVKKFGLLQRFGATI